MDDNPSITYLNTPFDADNDAISDRSNFADSIAVIIQNNILTDRIISGITNASIQNLGFFNDPSL